MKLLYLFDSEKKKLARGETIDIVWPWRDKAGIPEVGEVVQCTASPPGCVVVIERIAGQNRVILRAHTVAKGGASGDSTGAAVA